jgi:hypothetical protein
MKKLMRNGWLALCLAGVTASNAASSPSPSPSQVFSAGLAAVANLLEPLPGQPPARFSARLKVVKAEGVSRDFLGRELSVQFQTPDKARLSTVIDGSPVTVGRVGQELWVQVPAKQFAVRGRPGVLRFGTDPESGDDFSLPPIHSPLKRQELMLLPLFSKLEALPTEEVGGERCHVFRATPQQEALRAFKLPEGSLQFWVRETDHLPARIGYLDGGAIDVRVEIQDIRLGEAAADGGWQLEAAPEERVETVALSHLARFLRNAASFASNQMPAPLGAATGERRVVATEGQGRLEIIDGTKVLFVKGTPEEMGRQQGKLLRREVRSLVERVLYGVGVGSSFAKGRWFFDEIEEAQARQRPFVDGRYLREMDALAAAAGLAKEEVRLANFFPELFHCSGFAVFGEATEGGRIYHGRILDYMKGVGLEPNAVVTVVQPDQGHAWVNVGYAGFVGSVTAMNEKQVAIGEMGGRGEGQWDGKPMAQLVREVMEQADTVEEAVEIMRRGPRTCEYYYVISDGKTKRAVGIAATPDRFETIWPGEAHPQLPHAIKDAVLMSAGDRYEELARRVKSGHGKLDAGQARDLMTRPVCMTSNIHSVLFAPDTLDFWVANADARNVASHARYTRYNLRELLEGSPVVSGGP